MSDKISSLCRTKYDLFIMYYSVHDVLIMRFKRGTIREVNFLMKKLIMILMKRSDHMHNQLSFM